MPKVGSWVECIPNVEHKGISMRFFKTPDYPYPFCLMCLYRIRDRQGLLISAPTPIINRVDAKPEKDSL